MINKTILYKIDGIFIENKHRIDRLFIEKNIELKYYLSYFKKLIGYI